MVGRCHQKRLAAQQRSVGHCHIPQIVVFECLPVSRQASNPMRLMGDNGSTHSDIVVREDVIRVIDGLFISITNYSLSSRKAQCLWMIQRIIPLNFSLVESAPKRTILVGANPSQVPLENVRPSKSFRLVLFVTIRIGGRVRAPGPGAVVCGDRRPVRVLIHHISVA